MATKKSTAKKCATAGCSTLCHKDNSKKMPVREGYYLYLCNDHIGTFAEGLREHMMKAEEDEELSSVGSEHIGRPMGILNQVDANRTFDNVLKRLFGGMWDRLDPDVRAQSSQWIHTPVMHDSSVVGAFDTMSRNIVGYATAKKVGDTKSTEQYSSSLDQMPDLFSSLVMASFRGSERANDLNEIAKKRADGAKTLVKNHIQAAKEFIDAASDGGNDVAESRESFTESSDSVAEVIGGWCGDNIAKAADISRSMDKYQASVVAYVDKINGKNYQIETDWLKMGPKKVQAASIKAGQAIAHVVPGCINPNPGYHNPKSKYSHNPGYHKK